MGAMLWYHEVPWRPDPADALRAFQNEYFNARYDFAKTFEDYAQSTRSALEAERESGDQFGLVEIWENSLKVIEEIAAQPLPSDAAGQIAILRRVIATQTPDGFANVLDVTDVDDKGGTHVTRRLRRSEVIELTGTDRPTVTQAQAAIDRIYPTLGRSESVCFELFGADGGGDEKPTGWFFIGYTHD